MAGIVMDTATFAHPNATPRTLAVSPALVEAGAPLPEISRRLYRSKPDAQLRSSVASWTGSRPPTAAGSSTARSSSAT
jgi:nanoRNase/pAp phosphatase (c-di-AMP/oligoRNAs hydrolase)